MIEIIKAYIAGKTIEYRSTDPKVKDNEWIPKNPFRGDISFYPNDFEYRIKPETHVRYIKVFKNGAYNTQFTDPVHEDAKQPYHNLKLTFENNQLTKAEVM
jgi:hypothetical protein